MGLHTSLEVEAEQRAVNDRWQMNRAGILNFWYYDEEEFCMEEGRIILRGTNGSGKSVTMQSFIPLVLDGDKRPERLDPFGSRDRRLEYYLLGDAEHGHTDRTGYLWLEFYHSEKNVYKTIGIGIRARRGVVQLGFWGFLLDDGRRINLDFWLYDRSLWLEQGQKVPLNRKVLEEKISSGGQVVQEQSAYRELVNKTLFGFQDQDSYKDLLKLLLELRSPKLSKDFKPSSMYEILTNALPPLMEDELSPLSDVMEDMDQITDRLDELQLYRNELEKLSKTYDDYNRFLLKENSGNTLRQLDDYEKVSGLVMDFEQQKIATEKEQLDSLQSIEKHKRELGTVEAKLDVLNRSEAMAKQKELEYATEQLKETERQLVGVKERLLINVKRSRKVEEEFSLSKVKINVITDEQNENLEEMEDIARIIEFREHDIFHGMWLRRIPEDESWTTNWKKEFETHKKKLTSALEIARSEREASRAAAEAEVRLGDIHKERNVVEAAKVEREEKVEEEKDGLRDSLIKWQQNLGQLNINGDQLREMLRALSVLTIKERNYNFVRQTALLAYEQKNNDLLQQVLKLQQQRDTFQNECERIEQELEQWKMAKEPEPVRTEARTASRLQRGKGMGAPLYAVCEFDDSLTENEQAQLEETLAQAGLLDAWILPGGRVELLKQEEEEIWIEPYKIQGNTLANALRAAPSSDSGLSHHDVQIALESFEWLQERSMNKGQITEKGINIRSDGRFQLGPLSGTNCSKIRAEFIGKEIRLRTKQLEIAKLEADRQQVLKRILEIDGDLAEQKQKQQILKLELEAFPDDKELQIQFDNLIQVSYRLSEVMIQEQKVELWYKEKKSIWRELQLKLIEQTANWTSLKQEQQIKDAVDLCPAYHGCISELHSLWFRYRETLQHQSNLIEQQSDLSILLEEDYAQQQEFEGKKHKFTIQAEQLKKLITEMGIEEIHLQILQLKAEKSTLILRIEELSIAKDSVVKKLAEIEANLTLYKKQLQESQSTLNEALEQWKNEVRLALVAEWKEHLDKIDDLKLVRKLCKNMTREYDSLYTNTTKEKIFSELKDALTGAINSSKEYSLEHGFLASGRMIITSRRDRSNPLPPSKILDELIELENEQRILLTEKDRELYEEIILRSVGKAIRYRIHRARDWVRQMNELMQKRNTSSGLKLSLEWDARDGKNDTELDTKTLIELLMREAHRMDDEEIERVISHFRARVLQAKQEAQEVQGSLRRYIYDLLDYRSWFEFKLYHCKGEQTSYKELTDSKFNVLSGGEKAMAMYIPLFAATYSRYSDASVDAPKIISLDEAFAGVDDANMRDMFHLLTDMGFDFMMTSQVLWGCYDTVPRLAIYEIYRPKGIDVVTLFHYRWNGKRRILVDEER